MSEDLLRERKLAMMQLQQGKSMTEVSQNLDRSISWVSKWHQRFPRSETLNPQPRADAMREF